MKQITMDEWKNIHKDFKGILPDGTRSILEFVPGKGTCIVPVEVIKAPRKRK